MPLSSKITLSLLSNQNKPPGEPRPSSRIIQNEFPDTITSNEYNWRRLFLPSPEFLISGISLFFFFNLQIYKHRVQKNKVKIILTLFGSSNTRKHSNRLSRHYFTIIFLTNIKIPSKRITSHNFR